MVRLAPSRNHPIRSCCNDEADTSRQRIDDKILQPCMSTRCPKLQEFEDADRHDRHSHGEHPMPGVGEAESNPNQDEGERVFAILAEVGVRPHECWPERRERHRGGE